MMSKNQWGHGMADTRNPSDQGECTTRQRLLKRRGSADGMEAGASIKVNQGESK
jgi:hypothetical protein